MRKPFPYISRVIAAFALAAIILWAAPPPVSAACTGGMDNNSVSGSWIPEGSCSSPATYRAQTIITFNWVDATPRGDTAGALFSKQACFTDGTSCTFTHISWTAASITN